MKAGKSAIWTFWNYFGHLDTFSLKELEVKFIYSEKAPTLYKIFTVDLTANT